MKKVKLRTVRLSQLAPAAWRARGMTQMTLKGFRKSLEIFGPARLPVWNERTATLVDGVELVKALIADGETKTRTIVVDLSEGEAKALHVALHSGAFKGQWSPGAVATLLVDIRVEAPHVSDLLEYVEFEDMRANPRGAGLGQQKLF